MASVSVVHALVPGTNSFIPSPHPYRKRSTQGSVVSAIDISCKNGYDCTLVKRTVVGPPHLTR
ncbi:hypothetical protein CSUI_007619 [Cystoisospora suis]|uniref:Uncharacterized protein n=1 Tax=Cystoisospora suis TaxID=483139 RepID=A0A2C6KQC2_9APIC|nr:hypothetical protein CSUI_007619 [Cystoisospora suis]